jgi:osmotically-inducible protein OsmY
VNVPDSIKASVADRVITLVGEAPWHYQSTAATWAVHAIEGVADVRDRVRIRPAAPLDDIKAAIQDALIRHARFEENDITVTTNSGGLITLEGVVRSAGERRQAELVAWSAPGITAVTNNLTIQY